MAQNPELKTSLKQRIGVIIVVVALIGSTIALYMGIVLSYNSSNNPAINSEKQARFDELYSQYQEQMSEQAAELSAIHFTEFSAHRSRVKSYNAANVTKLTYEDLKIGTGETVTEGFTDYAAYYIGWLSDETIFDTSLNDPDNPTSLKNPLAGGDMIEGWNQGIIGMKIGGIREISIPAELAYGPDERGSIPANSPLKFIVMLIAQPETIDWSDEMFSLYSELYGGEY